jgi:hypothetical protein
MTIRPLGRLATHIAGAPRKGWLFQFSASLSWQMGCRLQNRTPTLSFGLLDPADHARALTTTIARPATRDESSVRRDLGMQKPPRQTSVRCLILLEKIDRRSLRPPKSHPAPVKSS